MAEGARVRGLADFQRELRSIDIRFPRELQKANKEGAEFVASRTRARATSNPAAAKAAGQVRAAGQQRKAAVAFSKTKKIPFVFGAFFGARRFRQFEPWVGNQFDPGDAGGIHRHGMPYHLAEVVEQEEAEFLENWFRLIDDLARKAWPDGRL